MSYAFDNIIGANGVRRIDHQSVSGVVHVEAEALKTLGDARFGFLQAEEEAAATRSRRFYGQFEAKQGFDVTGARTEQIGRAHVRTTVTNATLVCRLLIEK